MFCVLCAGFCKARQLGGEYSAFSSMERASHHSLCWISAGSLWRTSNDAVSHGVGYSLDFFRYGIQKLSSQGVQAASYRRGLLENFLKAKHLLFKLPSAFWFLLRIFRTATGQSGHCLSWWAYSRCYPEFRITAHQKYSSCLLLKKQIKNKYFSCLLFLTATSYHDTRNGATLLTRWTAGVGTKKS